MNAMDWVKRLDLQPHQEGGYFRQTYASPETTTHNGQNRFFATSILFLLTANNPSHLHRLSNDEIWYYHTGHSLTVHLLYPDGTYEAIRLGLEPGEHLQYTVPRGVIFGSSIDSDNPEDFALVSCGVTPGFDYRDFELFTQKQLLKDYPQHEEMIRRMAFETLNNA
ncbi:cupin domain-containing protein [Carnobacteriaceae bacterium zg-ZUI252]|nr:cupin domain-containing protein [Carnobacteriaceae bacterium zg-ZUI252]